MEQGAIAVLTDGLGRGYTVLCTIQEAALLPSLAAVAGPTGVVIVAGVEPVAGDGWSAVRCTPAQAIPVRAHVVDAAVLAETPDLWLVAEEVRRVLVPGGDVRVLLSGSVDVGAALRGASIRPVREAAGVLIARGP